MRSPRILTGRPARKAVRRRMVPLVSAVAILVGISAGSAWAYWSTSGSGSGFAKTESVAAVTVDAATGSPSTGLVPGGSADLVLTLNNPNGSAVTIVGVSENGTVGVVGGNGCTAANATVSVPSQTGLSLPVAPGTGVTVHVPNGVSMSGSSDGGCQGASFHIPVTLVVQR
jgi:hypothetical protein